MSASKDKLAASARAIVGNSLIGARGKTAEDQMKIDRTVARGCGGMVYSRVECARHGEEVKRS